MDGPLSGTADRPEGRGAHGEKKTSRDETNEQVAVDLSHCAAYRQQDALDFLKGEVPGILASMGVNARLGDEDGVVETDETVERLRQWREESPH